MTTTDELRRMLDERGVKWEKGASLTSMYTYWTDCNGHDVTAVGTDSVMFMSHFVTPEQAVEATLGRDECRRVMDSIDPFSTWVCDHCGHPLDKSENFCGGCGRRVKR